MKSKIMALRDANNLFREIWRMYQKYAVSDLSDAECEQLQQEADRLRKKYNSMFASNLLVVILRELSQISKMKGDKL
ncbi:MAG: hypothetical protein SOV77_09020 [Lachnospiraceae bacterium]|nr:hypothetical protein [Lachnospiraceae bacterium]MDY2614141.1 hypothetical protein [Lachnospiraceae bacterium]MDY4206513.1 hypothetical protein [Lachnospiraceae bacterium]